jgi:glutamate 5-kinase
MDIFDKMTKTKELYIIKIGTNTLVDDAGAIRDKVIDEILESAKEIIEEGNHALIVTSGAVRLGRVQLKNDKASIKVAAGVGQPLLFKAYQEHASKIGITISETLLTKTDIAEREHFLSLQRAFDALFEKGILPVVNENDVLGSGFDGNDPLACDLAISLYAKKLILVSNINGLYDDDPVKNKSAKFIPEVENITDDFLKYCSSDISYNSTGGMLSKLKVARISSVVGIETQIVNGFVSGNIQKAINGSGGTVFKARQIDEKVSNRDRWILVAKNSAGSIEVDDGAAKALRAGLSLLAVGAKNIYGEFDKGEVIEVIDKDKKGIAFGIVDFSHDKIKSFLDTADVKDKQLIHANNMFILK